jgi:hypothetical protein
VPRASIKEQFCMRARTTTFLVQWISAQGLRALALGGVLASGSMLPGCGADSDYVGYEGDEATSELGHSEQSIRARPFEEASDLSELALADPAPDRDLDPDPPPPPPRDPDTCESDPAGEVISALGLRALTYFGRVDPGLWECAPDSADCSAVRLSAVIREANQAPEQLAKLAAMDELLAVLSEMGGMGRFASSYRQALAACAEYGCPQTSFAFGFQREAPDECGSVRVTISLRDRRAPLAETSGELAQTFASSPAPARGGRTLALAQALPASLAVSSFDAAASVGSTSSSTSTSAAPVLGPFYGLYGHESDCDPADGVSCNGNETDTVIKTYLDHTCEGAPSAQDACPNTVFDTQTFFHDMIGAAVAVSERRYEKCNYWSSPGSKANNEPSGSGTIDKRFASSRLVQCILP